MIAYERGELVVNGKVCSKKGPDWTKKTLQDALSDREAPRMRRMRAKQTKQQLCEALL